MFLMKIYNYFNKSLSRQVVSLLGVCFLFFLTGSGLLFYYQHKIQDEYIAQREKIQEKWQVANYINERVNSDLLVMTDSIAIKVPQNRENALKQESGLRQQVTKLEPLIETEEERLIYQVIDNFTTYYFTEVLPPI